MADDLIVADPVYQTVLQLRQPGVLEEGIFHAWQEAGVKVKKIRASKFKILHIHYKPFDHARILVSAKIKRKKKKCRIRAKQYLFLQVYPRPDQAERRFKRGLLKRARRCYGPPITLLNKLATVVWALPNGPKLGPVRSFFRPIKFTKFLSKFALATPAFCAGALQAGELPAGASLPKVIRYVPRKRALFRLDAPRPDLSSVYFKVFSPGQGQKPISNLARLTKASDEKALKLRVPRILVQTRGKRVLVMEGLPGVRLTERMKEADNPAVFALVGHALAEFHQSRIQVSERWTPDEEVRRLETAMSDVKVVLPALEDRLNEVLAKISYQKKALDFNEKGIIHGNLFGDQILVHADQVGIVDWDDLCEGDPLYDLGRLIAHFILLAQQEHLEQARVNPCLTDLIDGYAKTAEKPIVWNRLLWHVSVALLMRAKISALRTLHPGWIGTIPWAMNEAGLILDGKSSWVSNLSSPVKRLP
jgi:tRNA A-37 threonylcarbamoyl transferase component Bud32